MVPPIRPPLMCEPLIGGALPRVSRLFRFLKTRISFFKTRQKLLVDFERQAKLLMMRLPTIGNSTGLGAGVLMEMYGRERFSENMQGMYTRTV